MSEAVHTAGPWALQPASFSHRVYVLREGAGDDEAAIADVIDRANAAHIARCVNSHDELLDALRKARTLLRRAANTAKTVGLGRDLNRQADEIDATILKATGDL